MTQGTRGSLVSDYFLADALARLFAGELGEAGKQAARSSCRAWWRGAGCGLGAVDTARTVFDVAAVPLARLLGFTPSSPRRCPSTGSLLAQLGAPSLPLMLVTGWGDDLSSTWRRSVRETLAAGTAWCISTNGRQVRLTDTRHSCARRHLEFDLETVWQDRCAFDAFWALLRRDAFETGESAPGGGGRLPLVERAVRESAARTVAVCRSLRAGVLDAVGELMDGLLPRTRRAGLHPHGDADLRGLHEQALTIVYRTLFLLFAESRGLVPTWHPTYRRSYSMEAARALAESNGPARGLWETLQAMSRLAHAGCRAGTLRVTPFNGRLFAPGLTPAGETGRPGDECARRVVLSLTTAPGPRGTPRARIAYRDLGVEQLGSVYEAVLDYSPVVAAAAEAAPAAGARRAAAASGPPSIAESTAGARRVRLVPGSGLRKATGTFYTPSSITEFIVRRALAPLVAGATPEQVLGLRVLDPAMGSGAFLVAACRYLAASYEEALVARGGCQPADIGDAERRTFRRLVAQNCLYGVDLNPTAVQLARLSLWLATLAPDRPLTFLDHRLLAGDSLVGASADDLVRRPFPGARHPRHGLEPGSLPLFGEETEAAVRAVLPGRLRLAALPDDTVGTVREKERLLASVGGAGSPLARLKQAADTWCALAYGLDSGERPPASLFGELADRLTGGRAALPAAAADRWMSKIAATARSHRFFHYTLEFPEVFFDASGLPRADAGFDAVLGNPPWDMLRGDAAGGGNRDEALRLARFARDSGLYRAQGGGHANRFQLFVERTARLARQGGRLGLVVPSGLLCDCGCATLRRMLLDRCEIDGIVGFDNTARIFPIHRSVRFVVFTATTGTPTARLALRLGERDASALDAIPDRGGDFPLVLSRSLLAAVSGDDIAVPDLRHPDDLALLEKLHAAAPALGGPGGWDARFGRELNASDDKGLFWKGTAGMPIVEGKHLRPFRLELPPQPLRLRPAALPGLGVLASSFSRARLAYRDVACPTNRLTSIAAIVPPGHATVHTLFCLKTPLDEREQWFLCAVLNSLVVNFLVRLRVTTHVTTGIVSRLPVPRPPSGSPVLRRMASLARALSRSADPERDPLYARLQGAAARLYRLERRDLEHVLAGFPLIRPEVKRAILEAWASGGGGPRGGTMG